MNSARMCASGGPAPALPQFLSAEEWRLVVASMQLSPQQARIVSLILQGKQDKEMAAALGLNRYTIRTYLRRVFDRVGVEDRMGLVLHIFAMCSTRRREGGCGAVPSLGDARNGSLF